MAIDQVLYPPGTATDCNSWSEARCPFTIAKRLSHHVTATCRHYNHSNWNFELGFDERIYTLRLMKKEYGMI